MNSLILALFFAISMTGSADSPEQSTEKLRKMFEETVGIGLPKLVSGEEFKYVYSYSKTTGRGKPSTPVNGSLRATGKTVENKLGLNIEWSEGSETGSFWFPVEYQVERLEPFNIPSVCGQNKCNGKMPPQSVMLLLKNQNARPAAGSLNVNETMKMLRDSGYKLDEKLLEIEKNTGSAIKDLGEKSYGGVLAKVSQYKYKDPHGTNSEITKAANKKLPLPMVALNSNIRFPDGSNEFLSFELKNHSKR